jgi:hypothetical protein
MNMKVNTEVMNIDGNDGCDFDKAAIDSNDNEHFDKVVTDASGNTICVGTVRSEMTDSRVGISLVKFDTNLNVLVRKVYNGSGGDRFRQVITDSDNNIICVGWNHSEGASNWDALVVKFDPNLNILARTVYSGTDLSEFRGVTIDDNDNIICIGHIASEGAGGWDALVVKFNSDLNVLANKIYSETYWDEFYAVAIDSSGNVICTGQTQSGRAGSWDALVVKYDSNLNVLAKKMYGGINLDEFSAVATDSNGNDICTGQTQSGRAGSWDALVVKYDSNLSILAKKIYDGAGSDIFHGVVTDSNDNIICVGRISEGSGNRIALIMKFDTNLNVLTRYIYNDTDSDWFYGVTTDDDDNIISVGWTNSGSTSGAGNWDVLVDKFDNNLNILASKVYCVTDDDDDFHTVATDSSGNIIGVGCTI